MESVAQRLKQIKSRIEKAEKAFSQDVETADEDSAIRKRFVDELRSLCGLIREVETKYSLDPQSQSEDWAKLILDADRILKNAIDFAYAYSSGEETFDFLPSFADTPNTTISPMAEDTLTVGVAGIGYGAMEKLMQLLVGFNPMAATALPKTPVANVDLRLKPHPLSSKIARFRENASHIAQTRNAGPQAQMIYQARCESCLHDAVRPVGRICISEDDGRLAMLGICGWKERDPAVTFFDIAADEMEQEHRTLGFHGIAFDSTIDSASRLFAVADNTRVKTMRWSEQGLRLLYTHTLNSGPCNGPMTFLNNNLIRAGKGQARLWNLETAPTHGPEGDELIGEELSSEDSWRDNDGDEIELSSGSKHDGVIQFVPELKEHKPSIWTLAPSFTPSTVLSSASTRENPGSSVVAIDLESNAQVSARYLGHGALMSDITMSFDDPNTFITACGDGYARLFDKRQTLPVMSFDAMNSGAMLNSALCINPNGLPLVITDARQAIKVWDVRAKTVVYELATGNDTVVSLAWDNKRTKLYAAVDCDNLTRMGYFMDYRRARIPRTTGEDKDDGMDDSEEDEYEDDDDDDDYDVRCWPENAYHQEEYFEYVFDAGRHGLLQYSFKEEPDVEALPAYGDADLRGDSFF